MVTAAGEKKKSHEQVVVPHIDAAVSVSDMVSSFLIDSYNMWLYIKKKP